MKIPSLTLAIILVAGSIAATAFAQKPDPKKPAAPVPVSAATGVHDVTPAQAEKLIAERKDIVVLDVRTSDEYDMGHVAGATNISFLDVEFAKKVQEIEGKPIILHCSSGSRSGRALNVLKTKNFPEIYHMTGGYKAWTEAGKPVVGTGK